MFNEEWVGRVGAAAFAVMGAVAVVSPPTIPRLMGLSIEASAGRNEVRAVYDSFGLAVAASLVAGDVSHRAAARGESGLALPGGLLVRSVRPGRLA